MLRTVPDRHEWTSASEQTAVDLSADLGLENLGVSTPLPSLPTEAQECVQNLNTFVDRYLYTPIEGFADVQRTLSRPSLARPHFRTEFCSLILLRFFLVYFTIISFLIFHNSSDPPPYHFLKSINHTNSPSRLRNQRSPELHPTLHPSRKPSSSRQKTLGPQFSAI
jgi:hypothetical protein